MKQFREYYKWPKNNQDTILTRDQFIDFVNWMGMSDVIVQEDRDGWFRIQFIQTEE